MSIHIYRRLLIAAIDRELEMAVKRFASEVLLANVPKRADLEYWTGYWEAFRLELSEEERKRGERGE